MTQHMTLAVLTDLLDGYVTPKSVPVFVDAYQRIDAVQVLPSGKIQIVTNDRDAVAACVEYVLACAGTGDEAARAIVKKYPAQLDSE